MKLQVYRETEIQNDIKKTKGRISKEKRGHDEEITIDKVLIQKY
jgi:hypothetical protein